MVLSCVMMVMWFVGVFGDPSTWKLTVKSILTAFGLLKIKTKFSTQLSTKLLSSLKKSSTRKTTITTPQNKANGSCRLALMAGTAKVHSIPFLMTSTEATRHEDSQSLSWSHGHWQTWTCVNSTHEHFKRVLKWWIWGQKQPDWRVFFIHCGHRLLLQLQSQQGGLQGTS